MGAQVWQSEVRRKDDIHGQWPGDIQHLDCYKKRDTPVLVAAVSPGFSGQLFGSLLN